MPLTASKFQTSVLLNLSTDKIEDLISAGLLERTGQCRFVQVTLASISKYANAPIELVHAELRQIPYGPTRRSGKRSQAARQIEENIRNAAAPPSEEPLVAKMDSTSLPTSKGSSAFGTLRSWFRA